MTQHNPVNLVGAPKRLTITSWQRNWARWMMTLLVYIVVLNLLMLLRAFIMVRDNQEGDDLSNETSRHEVLAVNKLVVLLRIELFNPRFHPVTHLLIKFPGRTVGWFSGGLNKDEPSPLRTNVFLSTPKE